MPEMPVQLVIMKRLTAHLAGMTVLGGYGFDMCGAVFRGRTVFGAADPLPCLSVLESPESTVGVAGGVEHTKRLTRWSCFIQGFVRDDKENPTDPGYWLKAYTQKRLAEITAERPNGQPLYPDVFRLGRTISGLVIENGVVRPPHKDVSDKAFFWLPVTIEYAADPRNPMMEVADVDNP